MVFPDKAVCFTAQSHYDIPKDTVVHIQTPFPDDLACIDTERVALLDMVV